ncbi:PadR family transcriptional regulator [Streptomyces mangrovisoli]|uniref:PadR family transcriptional regulator n=1 Tax=Streptomyces mangrovisoli TaxID=1428628 RepID=A0A1J4P7P7_9ACTN|nr:PadR family transcriptional regulator [Streptomyces mangrovisoli]OIJ69542.1 PadR family transcriptional regulator [Streptomyces mangrovisoli]
MSTRHGLLALLEQGPRPGSRLRSDFAARTGGLWPLTAGQVNTALVRLERDGMVVQQAADEAGRALYALTDTGRAELYDWFGRSVERSGPLRDGLVIKLVLAVTAAGADVREVVEAQRRHVSQALQDRLRQRAQVLAALSGRPEEMARLLVLEQLVCRAEADLRWLDHCEARVLRLAQERAG